MPDQFTSREARVRAVLVLLAAKGPLSAGRIACELRTTRDAVTRCLALPLFEPEAPGRRTRYRLSEAGRCAAEERA
ncbi:hypothetical protein J8F10_22280 [Gemmata sp. G18]|uniref:HTH marR-type domain-containing protein n=1 Tax=Gemmata palustris TaxID=2822762 RepID=A0ABS5BW87_9BACT|nr:hypothetical protein [Gemmata palustris]MBP3957992.1 hypothetical protein [Gemmata palustris]